MRAKRAQKGGVKPSWTRARRAQEGGCRNHMQASSCLQNRPISAHFPKNFSCRPLLRRQDDSRRALVLRKRGLTISRILRFAHGLAGRGVSNHRDHWSAGKGGVATGCERSEGRKGGIKASSERSERRRGWSVRVPQNSQIMKVGGLVSSAG